MFIKRYLEIKNFIREHLVHLSMIQLNVYDFLITKYR
jgi:hypothetical protein